MKIKIVLLAAVFICSTCTTAFAQRPAQLPFVNDQNDKPLTDLEQFQDIYGALLIKGFTNLTAIRGNTGTLQISIIEFRNAANNTRVKGVVADITTTDRQNERSRSFIEYSELDTLIRGMTLLSKLNSDASPLQGLEAVFTTKGEFSISNFLNRHAEPRISVTAGRRTPTTHFIDQSGQSILLGQLQQAKETLDQLQ